MSSDLLKNTLRGNAIFSVFCALDLLLFSEAIAALIGLPDARFLFSLGIALIGFAAFVWWVSSQQPISPTLAQSIIWMDAAWVIGSVLLVLFKPEWLTVAGVVLIIAVAIAVELFAYFQYRGLKRVQTLATAS
ncbi:hypothetical protein [Marinicella sp. W31]|uniref:hypothetical protein n=1 Tax=Marinicella sp. W31 TaxID=3023713 RepID=UPI003756FAEA